MATPFSKDEFVKSSLSSSKAYKLVIANLQNRDYRGEPYVEETMEEG